MGGPSIESMLAITVMLRFEGGRKVGKVGNEEGTVEIQGREYYFLPNHKQR